MDKERRERRLHGDNEGVQASGGDRDNPRRGGNRKFRRSNVPRPLPIPATIASQISVILRTANINAFWAITTTLAILFFLQFVVDPTTFTTGTILAMAITFWYKTMAFGTFGWILWHQDGTSKLSRTGRNFFLALFSQALLLAIAFTLASVDRILIDPPQTASSVGEARNVVRNITISTTVAVVIYGSRMMDAVFDMLRTQAIEDNISHHGIPPHQQ